MSPEHAENVSEARTRADNPVPQREAFLVKQFHNASSNPSKACVRQLRFRRQNREEEGHSSLGLRDDQRLLMSFLMTNDE